MTAFDRLSPALAYQIVNTLNFRELRPVQLASIDAVLDGKNCVVLAPTAGGKTESAFFPLLSRMESEGFSPVSAIYLSPIRALLNNQEARIQQYAGLIARRAFKWHGDTSDSARKRFVRDPADILLTTPESLEAMLMSTRVPAAALFRGLQAVVIDEVHAFANDDRGSHLSSLLERLVQFCGRDIQRIGLSATVGNPKEILRWLQGSSSRDGIVVNPSGAKKMPEISLDYIGSAENAAVMIQALHPGKKRLVFVESRRLAEQLGALLTARGVMTFVAHGSLSASERKDAERAFQDGGDCVIVATSAMELGIDVGDLDHVLQIDCPSTIASFLQRMGRTGRRAHSLPNCTFLALKDLKLVQAAGLIELYRTGYVEPVEPDTKAMHIFAHQVMTLGVQRSGIVREDIWPILHGASAFRDITESTRDAIIEHMLSTSILADHDGRLWLGAEGERRFGRANFRELYAVFESPRMIVVRAHNYEVGTVDAKFLTALASDPKGDSQTFTLAGKAWKIVHLEWERGICQVVPAPEGRAARWHGGARWLSRAMCQSIRQVLSTESEDPSWSKRARAVIATSRAEHTFLRDCEAPLYPTKDGIAWWNFAGGSANLLLARLLEETLGARISADNFKITFRERAGLSADAIVAAVGALRNQGHPSRDDAARLFQASPSARLSKFAPCLPETLQQELGAREAFDLEDAQTTLANQLTVIHT